MPKPNMPKLYPYSSGDRIAEPNTYNYSPYHGEAFLDAWKKERDRVAHAIGKTSPPPPRPKATLARSAVSLLVRRFEVRKGWRTPYRCLLAAEIFELAYGKTGKLPCLNALLKAIDILCSVYKKLPTGQKQRLAWLIARERIHINRL